MRTFVLIGGIGSGKSTVSRMLRELGTSCIDLDAVGHGVLEDPQVRRELSEAFGEAVLAGDGTVDRRALAARAFASPEATQALNAITQPRIVERALQRLADLEGRGCQVAVVEISPYAGPGGPFDPIVDAADGIVAVIAPEELRMARAVERGLSESDVRSRMARQATDEQRCAWADLVVENDDDVDSLCRRVSAAFESMTHGVFK